MIGTNTNTSIKCWTCFYVYMYIVQCTMYMRYHPVVEEAFDVTICICIHICICIWVSICICMIRYHPAVAEVLDVKIWPSSKHHCVLTKIFLHIIVIHIPHRKILMKRFLHMSYVPHPKVLTKRYLNIIVICSSSKDRWRILIVIYQAGLLELLRASLWT